MHDIFPETGGLHYQIGNCFWRTTPRSELERKAFFLTRQFNAGVSCLRKNEEKFKVAYINYLAAKRSKEMFSYDSAAAYVAAAIEVLPELNWDEQGDLLLSIYLIKAEAAAFQGRLEAADELVELVLRNIRNPDKKAEVFYFAMVLKAAVGRYAEGGALGIRGLRELGIGVEANPSAIDVLVLFYKVRSQFKKVGYSHVARLPRVRSSYVSMLFALVASNAYFYDKRLFQMMVLLGCQRTLNEGFTDGSSVSLMLYASSLAGRLAHYEDATKLAGVVIEASREASEIDRVATRFTYSGLVQLWSQSLEKCINELDCNYAESRAKGQTAAAIMSALYSGAYSVFSSSSLTGPLVSKLDDFLSHMSQHHSQVFFDSLLGYRLAVKSLCGETSSLGSFSTPELAEDDFVKRLKSHSTPNPLAWYGVSRLWVDTILCRYQEALNHLPISESFLAAAPAAYGTVIHRFCATVVMAAVYKKAGWKKWSYKLAMRRHLRSLQRLAQFRPDNFLTLYLLARAEYDRSSGRYDKAADGYVEVIFGARRMGLIHIEALAEELIGKFKREIGVNGQAGEHFKRAHQLYMQWGALAKAQLLEGDRIVCSTTAEKFDEYEVELKIAA